MTVVCIAGMHRSGTSLVARLLNLCGLYLGKDEELMRPTQDNADGYWENLRFVEMNDGLLSQLNGTWSLPPSSDSILEMQKQPPLLVGKAQKLIQDFNGEEFWGWKDPRNSLTLPFWQKHIPNLKVINCLRNPLEVAQSLAKRDHFLGAFSLELWYTYCQRLLSAAAPEKLLTTHYDIYFINPRDELYRLLKFIGIPADEKKVEMACAAAKPLLRHNRSTLEYLIAEGAPLKIVNLYAQLCSQAGPVYWNAIGNKISEPVVIGENGQSDIEYGLLNRLVEKDPVVLSLVVHIAKKEMRVQALSTQVAEREQVVQALSTQVAEREQAVQALSTQVAEREQVVQALSTQVAERDQQVQVLTAQVAEKERAVQVLTSQISERDTVINRLQEESSAWLTQIQQIYQSKSWRFTHPWRVLSALARKLRLLK